MSVSVRRIHDLWYSGNAAKRIGPYRHVVTAGFDTVAKKYVSYARKCVQTVDAYMPVSMSEYEVSNSTAKDTYSVRHCLLWQLR